MWGRVGGLVGGGRAALGLKSKRPEAGATDTTVATAALLVRRLASVEPDIARHVRWMTQKRVAVT